MMIEVETDNGTPQPNRVLVNVDSIGTVVEMPRQQCCIVFKDGSKLLVETSYGAVRTKIAAGGLL